jgi:hypothetical protein
MALKSTLESAKARLDALLTYANETTGESDTSIGDAIQTLCAGYGGGGYSLDDIASGAEPSGAIEISDSVSTLRDYAFFKCNITSVTWNDTTMRGTYPFHSSELQSFSAPYATGAGGKILCNCRELTNVSLPLLQDIGTDQFIESTKVQQLIFPSLNNRIYRSAFRFNTLLKVIDAGRCSSIGGAAFNGCTVLDTLILRKSDSICTIEGVNVFNGTPFANGGTGGEIYVPSALIDTYKAAAQWSILDGYGTITWKAIEGSIYEHAYADGTPIA